MWVLIMCDFFDEVFGLTLLLYILTLIFVTYVGVYLTYIAVPIIVISGAISHFCDKKNDK